MQPQVSATARTATQFSPKQGPDYLDLAARQIANLLVLLLLAAAGVSIWLDERLEANAIGAILHNR